MQQVCVSCNAKNNGMIAIYQHPNGLDEMFLSVTGIEVKPENHLCVPCYDDLKLAHRFKQRCIQNGALRLSVQAHTNQSNALPEHNVDSSPDVSTTCVESTGVNEANETIAKKTPNCHMRDIKASSVLENCHHHYDNDTSDEISYADQDPKSPREEVDEIENDSSPKKPSAQDRQRKQMQEDEQNKTLNSPLNEEPKATFTRLPKVHSLMCEYCFKEFATLAEKIEHTDSHRTELKPFKCVHSGCSGSFKDRVGLRAHVRIHATIKRHACRHCTMRFHTLSNQKAHERTHNGEKPYICPKCGKGFAEGGNLKNHIRSHNGERPYPCSVCDKSYRTHYSRTVHMRTHTNDRPFVCDDCGKGFYSSGKLTTHRRTHTGERPYKCTSCPSRFIETCGLKRHIAKCHKDVHWSSVMKVELDQKYIFLQTLIAQLTRELHAQGYGLPVQNSELGQRKGYFFHYDKQTDTNDLSYYQHRNRQGEQVMKHVKSRDQLCIPCYDELRIAHRFKEKCIHNNINRLGLGITHRSVPHTQPDLQTSDDSINAPLVGETDHISSEECIQIQPARTEHSTASRLDFAIKSEPSPTEEIQQPVTDRQQDESVLLPNDSSERLNQSNHDAPPIDVVKMELALSLDDIGLRAESLSEDDDEDSTKDDPHNGQHERAFENNESVKGPALLQCVPCGIPFLTRAALKQHQQHEHKKIRRDNTNAVRYRRVLSGKINALMCRYCYREFNEAEAKTAHEITHLSDPKPFQCSYGDCNRLFQHRSALNRHFYTHVTPKRFKCSVCPKRFHQQSSMIVHERLHRGDKPHICPQCGKGFTHVSNVKRHIRFHNGEKPYQCGKCPARFTTSTDLRRHMNSRRCMMMWSMKGSKLEGL
uniref:C2H2-type domain-containing protein n=1 Tax=Anopheles farauti TaxID=69004 RepID=A0A182Q7C2_9DIPT